MPTVSDLRFIKLKLPTSWQGLTPRQLSYLCSLLAAGHESPELAHRMLLHCAALTPTKPPRGKDPSAHYFYHHSQARPLQINPDDLAELLQCFDFLDTPPTAPLLPPIDTHQPQSPHLYDLAFSDYLDLQLSYATFLDTRDSQYLDLPIKILWNYKRDEKGKYKEEIPADALPIYHVALHLFMTALNPWLSQAFPHLFANPDPDSPEQQAQQSETAMAMIRALTAGDVTKEPAVRATNTISALYELNQKAREAEEIRKQQRT